MNEQQQIQQGDVILRRVNRPETMPPAVQRGGRLVLAEGEATGHAHVVEDEEAELIRDGERILLNLTRAATVKHQEHKAVTLGPGLWEVGRVQEFDYLSMMARRVQD
jgi:hypothetical protein